jgi:hypothetical protein
VGFGRRSHIEVVVHIKLLLVRKLHGEAYFYKASGLQYLNAEEVNP